jgi:hypothetical protein
MRALPEAEIRTFSCITNIGNLSSQHTNAYSRRVGRHEKSAVFERVDIPFLISTQNSDDARLRIPHRMLRREEWTYSPQLDCA